MPSTSLNRRGFLGAAGAAGLTVAGGGLLTACGDGGAQGGGAEASAKLKLPTYVPAKVPAPDLPGNAQGLDPAYLRYPKDLVKSVTKAPGDGKPITCLTETFTTPAPAMNRNGYWQELNKRLGSEMHMTIVNGLGADSVYREKFNAMIAGGDLPDLMWFPPNQGLKNVPDLLRAKFHDLTPYLSGDAVKKYPNLANIPGYAWKTAVINGRIWGYAVPYGRSGQVYVANENFWKPVGGTEFESAQDFFDKAKELLDTKRKKYVLEPAYANHIQQFAYWHGAPNTWRLDGGKLTYFFETEEYLAGIEFALKCRQAELFWPDPNLTTTLEKMEGGFLGLHVQSFPGFLNDSNMYDWPEKVVVPFAAEKGSTPTWSYGYGSVGFTAISNKVPKSRIPTLLKVLDYLSAPMGTEERLFLDNGIEGTHYTRSRSGDVALTKKGNAEVLTTRQAINFFGNAPESLYLPNKPDVTRSIHAAQTELMKLAQVDPTIGYFSDTFAQKGASAKDEVYTAVKDIVAGRKPLSSFKKEALPKWRRTAGDAMRHEYEQAIAKGTK
ncbi:hypothetical protein [Streptomyces sp. VRA16 Mangrove soil]|uniref:hypothetical protein n=1 Tax=Streptomyces sp. VRA16 Mangrove soil TaxID=2817434 RepID=UPI001A9E3D6A|nr:hypothetical protein [Streptomyces sp. VRA16 Mangrove soil]MBO1331072.1 hypothetical protein [Streptomyces sp. VRA16 Mangrove soil]